MKAIRKPSLSILSFLFVIFCLLFASCSHDGEAVDGETGTFTISIGGGSVRAATWLPAGISPSDLTHTITVTPYDGVNRIATIVGDSGSANFSVPVGDCEIYIEGRAADGIVYSQGWELVNILLGANPLIIIQMTPPKVPLSMSVVQLPSGPCYEGAPSRLDGVSFEGLPANLNGIALNVMWSDGSFSTITDPNKLTTNPHIMLAPTVPGPVTVDVVFRWRNVVVTAPLSIPEVMSLLDVHWTGSLAKLEYCVDDIPDFAGISGFEGVYNSSNDPTDLLTDYYHMTIPIVNNPWYLMQPGIDFMYTDNLDPPNPGAGIIIQIGSLGNLDMMPPRGVAIPINTVYQLDVITVETQPVWNTTFTVSTTSSEFETALFSSGLTFRLSYAGTSTTMIFTMGEFLLMQTKGRASIDTYPVFSTPNPFVRLKYRDEFIDITVPLN